MKTSGYYGNSAQLCREMRWLPGQVLEDAHDPAQRIRITAIGRESILAEQIHNSLGHIENPVETYWNLRFRDWNAV